VILLFPSSSHTTLALLAIAEKLATMPNVNPILCPKAFSFMLLL
jgi:hypothetical protein